MLALIWFVLDAQPITATRQQVRAWATELGLSEVVAGARNAPSFEAAYAGVAVDYVEDGLARRAVGRAGPRPAGPGVWTVSLECQDDMVELAQVQYHPKRRLSRSTPAGSELIRHVVRKGISDAARTAAQEWLRMGLADYDRRHAEVPRRMLRDFARRAVGRVAVPLRELSFFGYVDELSQLYAVQTLLQRATGHSEMMIFPLAGPLDLEWFRECADRHLVGQVEELVGRLDRWVDSTVKHWKLMDESARWRGTAFEVAERITVHERELGGTLPQTRERLAVAIRMIAVLDPSGALPNVRP